ncbi:hypothetical protein PGB90_001043 [Kerria lacca]
MMYLYVTSIFWFIQTATCISVASTSSPYTASPNEANYAPPSTVEPTTDYKSNNPHGQFPYARQFFEPLFNPSNPYSESLTSPNPLTQKPFLFHRVPFLPSAPFTNPAYVDQPTPYNLAGYPTQPPYSLPNYPNQPFFEPHYPFTFPQKFAKSPYSPADCDFHPSSFRNTKPILFYPHKPDTYFDSPLTGKPSNVLYRFQPPPYGANFANIYH